MALLAVPCWRGTSFTAIWIGEGRGRRDGPSAAADTGMTIDPNG
jgi:hypothetical protein